MALMEKISQSDCDLIVAHLTGCLDVAETTTASFRRVVQDGGPDWATASLRYWDNVGKGMRFAIQMAKDRVEGSRDGRIKTVQ
jgi:hypothetical protein